MIIISCFFLFFFRVKGIFWNIRPSLASPAKFCPSRMGQLRDRVGSLSHNVRFWCLAVHTARVPPIFSPDPNFLSLSQISGQVSRRKFRKICKFSVYYILKIVYKIQWKKKSHSLTKVQNVNSINNDNVAEFL